MGQALIPKARVWKYGRDAWAYELPWKFRIVDTFPEAITAAVEERVSYGLKLVMMSKTDEGMVTEYMTGAEVMDV